MYDFDHTIYRGDASLDFILFSLRRNKKALKHVPGMLVAVLLYIFGLHSRKDIKQVAFRFLVDIDDVDKLLDEFWFQYGSKVKHWYRNQGRSSDIIISASPEFLLQPIAEALGVRVLIATRMDKKTGSIKGENCRSTEKVLRLKAFYLDRKQPDIENVYSDSQSDIPILELGRQGYIVKGDKCIDYRQYTPPKWRSIVSPAFIRFLFVGGVSAAIGVSLSYLFSQHIASALVAFILGFVASLAPSYFLNSIVTFKDFNFTLKKVGKFVISYTPNFLVQLVFVYFLAGAVGFSPFLSYTIAVIVAVPVTFLILRWFTFRNEEEHEE